MWNADSRISTWYTPLNPTRAGALTPAAVGRGEVDLRPEGDDPRRVDHCVGHVVVALDLVERNRLGDPGELVELARVAPQLRVVDDPPRVALEVPDVDRVEADKRRKEAPVGSGELLAEKVAPGREQSLEPVERVEQRPDRVLVGVLAACEAAAVDPVVDRVVDALVDLVDPRAPRRRVEVRAARERARVEHPDDLDRLVVDDPPGLAI